MEILLETEDMFSILVSILCGSIIGFEREYSNKSAGFRTIILICLGSTIFTLVSRHGTGSDDRIAANIITGIGFIGAGVIFKDRLSVLGLTTAAVIWTTAGIGMATGKGYHLLAFCLTLLTLLVLTVFSRIEGVIEQLKHTKIITLTFTGKEVNQIYQLEEGLKRDGIKYKRVMMNKSGGKLLAVLQVSGNQKQFDKLDERLVTMETIEEFYYHNK
ncbi:MgtC/SapB family protein [Flavisolibacter sp. BT320]|nr:MgtC/SapB family protein [Flavisolibacter longurius]